MSAHPSASRLPRELPMLGALALICGFFAFASPQFLGSRNLSMLAIELSITATLALGMLLVLLPGHIDLSAGSGVGLLGGVASVLIFRHGWPAAPALAAALVLGVCVWLAMGALVVRQRMPSFIITLGGLLVFKGLFWLVIRSATVPISPGGEPNLYALLTTYYLPKPAGWALAAFCAAAWARARVRERAERLADGLEAEDAELLTLRLVVGAQAAALFTLVMSQFRGVPLPVVVLGVVALGVAVLTERTRFGRYLYAIGGNEEAALVSGVPVDRAVIVAFGLMGAITAVTGLMQTAYAGASTTTVGELMELDAVAACVIGGVSLKGGRGTASGVLFGSLIMTALLNGMTLLAVPPELKLIARGTVLALAVWLDVRLSRPR